MEAFNNACLWITDLLFGWLLLLPRDAALIAVALISALVLTLVRLVATDQDLLKRCGADTRRLKELKREARRQKNVEAVGRYRATMQQIHMVKFRAEAKPLLVSLVPIALLAIWCFARIAYVAPQPGGSVLVEMELPVEEARSLAHILPQTGLRAETGWIQRAETGESDDASVAVARWRLRADASDRAYRLSIRHAGETYAKTLIVDGRHYAPPLEYFGDVDIRLGLQEYKPFGIVPAVGVLALPPWIVGYLIVVMPLALILKWLLKIA